MSRKDRKAAARAKAWAQVGINLKGDAVPVTWGIIEGARKLLKVGWGAHSVRPRVERWNAAARTGEKALARWY